MAKRRKVDAAPPRNNHARTSSWAGLHEGDRVDVDDERERRSTWRFVAHVTNVATGESWVEVVGGTAGAVRVRSFRPDQLFPYGSVRSGQRRVASLADAPGLPL